MNTEEKPDATAIKREAELLVALRNHLISAVEEAQSYKYFVWHNSALSMPHVHRANELSAALVDKLAWVKCRLSEVAAATRADQGYVEPSPTNSDLTTECQVLRAERDALQIARAILAATKEKEEGK